MGKVGIWYYCTKRRIVIIDFEKPGIIPKEKAEEAEKLLKAEGYKLQKTSLARGYISRRTAGSLEPYKGIYGEGYK